MRRSTDALNVSLVVGLIATVVVVAASPAPAVQAPHARIVSADPADHTPNILNGQVNAVVVVGDTVIAGGRFQWVAPPGGTAENHPNIVAFSASTGDISTTFAPKIDGEVLTLATNGEHVYAGGRFKHTNGVRTRRLVKLDMSGDVVSSFRGQVTFGTAVYDLVLANRRLYVAGAFDKIRSTPRTNFAALYPSTGLVDQDIDVEFQGLHNGGVSHIAKIDVTPDGSQLVAVGNFTSVGGQQREQIAVLDLKPAPVSLSSWSTEQFVMQCADRFDTYIRDVDISPDGAYFVVVTTGAFFGGANSGTLCDTTTRWEVGRTGPSQLPTWVAYAGGDTTWSVAATGAAVYVGGHFRWYNNPFAGDTVGPGTVKRKGIAALDPINGVPFSWNPSRKLGEGAFALVATANGLWVGSDTDEIGHEHHGRIAFFPLAGGRAVPEEVPARLPGELYTLPGTCPSVDTSALYRVNAAGPPLPTLDCGPGWERDDSVRPSPYRNIGSSSGPWGPVPFVDGTVPSSTPPQVFSTERWDGSGSPEMQWDFPVDAGTRIRVRLYFADRCVCTDDPGDRVFDVGLEGTIVLNNFDITAQAGHDTGTMRAFDITSDGNITITFRHGSDNPLINAIEIIDRDAPTVSAPSATHMRHRTFDGAVAGVPVNRLTSSTDWSHVRGAFVTNGFLYTGWDTGRMYRQTFSGGTLGRRLRVYLNGLQPLHFPVASISGMFFEHGRLYYTLAEDGQLYYRYFTPESNIFGPETFVVSGAGEGFDWGSVRGMTLAEGRIYVGRDDGTLESIDWSNGAPVSGSTRVIDVDPAQRWASRGMFVLNS